MAHLTDPESLIETEFWWAEVKSGVTVRVIPGPVRAVYISQISLGLAEKDTTGPILVKLKVVDGPVFEVGPLSAENTPQLSGKWLSSKPFEISHSWKYGSVYLLGHTAFTKYCAGKPESSAKPKDIASEDSDPSEDSSSDSELSEDSSSESDHDSYSEDVSEDDKETPKKRPSESHANTPHSANKANLETPQRTALCNPPYPNKRPRLTDSPRHFSEESTFAIANFVASLQRGKTRVKKLLSERSDLSETLMKLEANFEEVLGLISMPTHNAHQRGRFYELIRPVLELWGIVEDQIEQQQQSCTCELALTPSDYPEPVPSAWVMMSDWHGPAYQEILSIRSKHSRLLDRAYKVKHGECSEINKVSGPLLLYKKQLNFLAISREDISALSKDKCYEWVMRIKSLVTQEKYTASRNLNENLPEQGASRKLRVPARCSWRDDIYEQIIDIRKKHSCKLDKAYSNVHELSTSMDDENVEACLEFLRRSLQFLANCRADLVFLSKKKCREQLNEIKLFVEEASESVPANKFLMLKAANGHWRFISELKTSLTNWRDVAYEKLQTKADRFRYLIYNEYEKRRERWCQELELVTPLHKLDEWFRQVRTLYEMPRARMSLFVSKEDYFDFVDQKADFLCRIKDLIKELPGGGSLPEWDPLKMIPKRYKLSHLDS